MSTSSALNATSTSSATAPAAAPTEPIISLSSQPLPTDPAVVWAFNIWKGNKSAIALMNDALYGNQASSQKREVWPLYVDGFKRSVESAERRIAKEACLTEKGKETMRKAVAEIGGMLEKYRKLPSGVTLAKRRADKLTDMLVIVLDEEEKKQQKTQ